MDKRRPKFIRQKSFEIDSDSTDIDASLTPSTERPQKNDNAQSGKKPVQDKSLGNVGSGESSTSSWCRCLKLLLFVTDEEAKQAKMISFKPVANVIKLFTAASTAFQK